MTTPATGQPDAAWSEHELANPHQHAHKPDKVRSMFAAIAGSYDLNNRVHSLWQDQAWRRAAVRAASLQRGDRVLDVACGTGDLTEVFAAASETSEVIGLDFTPQMLRIAEQKLPRNLVPDAAGKVRYLEGDAQQLPFADGEFDVVSIAFGLRNVADPTRALREFARVLRPGGRVIILEFDRPSHPPMRWFYDFYCGWLMPRTATAISGDRSGAYRYLPRSVGSFMPRRDVEREITSAGFETVASRALSLGICICYRGVRQPATVVNP